MLFTDIEGSTKLLQRTGDRYAELLRTHRRLLREAFDRHQGIEIDSEGDAFFVAFTSADNAIAAAASAQEALSSYDWPDGNEIRVRMGLHTGSPRFVDGGYVGLDVHRAARVMAAGHGGQILLSHATKRRIDTATRIVDLGEHRLKDLLQPEHLFQLVVDGLPAEFPALKTLGNRPTNLPVQPNEFIGREIEIHEITSRLRDDAGRLLTLTGPGGTGKTRLALQSGAEVLDDFRSGVFFVSLAPIRDPALVVPTIAQTLALREVSGEEIADTLRAYLSDKHMLLVLDNLEQVVEAGSSLAQLLEAAREVKLLVTSRVRLRVALEQIYEVQALPSSEADELFVTRAQAAKPDLALTESTERAITNICVRLEGLPLALELAAARVTTLTPEGLLRRLDERLSLLTGGPMDVDERQRTLRNTIDWSYELLDEVRQGAFEALSVFVDGCRLDAVEAVCGADLDTLQTLLESSLLRQRVDPDGEPRFWMLETIREYAGERLQQRNEADSLRQAHAEYFGRVAEEVNGLIRTPDVIAAFNRLGQDRENFRAALEWFRDRNDDERLVGLASSLGHYWTMRGQVRDGRYWLDAAIATGAGESYRVNEALRFAFWLAWFDSDDTRAEELARAISANADAFGGTQDRAYACAAFAQVAQLRDEHERAQRLHEEGLRLSRQTGDRHRIVFASIWLGVAALRSGDHAASRAALEESLAIGRELELPDVVGKSLEALAETALHEGKTNEAEALFREALPIARELGNREGVAICLSGFAAIAARRQEWARAARLAGAEEVTQAQVEERRDPFRVAAGERFYLAALRDREADEEISAALADGRRMTVEAAIEYALAREPDLRPA